MILFTTTIAVLFLSFVILTGALNKFFEIALAAVFAGVSTVAESISNLFKR